MESENVDLHNKNRITINYYDLHQQELEAYAVLCPTSTHYILITKCNFRQAHIIKKHRPG